MSPAAKYRVWYSHSATEFLLALSARDQWLVWTQANELARHPFLRRGYRLTDTNGHELEHHIVGPWILAYWIDHAQRAVILVEIETKD